MSSHKARDFYSPEAVREVETFNALEAQLEKGYRRALERAGEDSSSLVTTPGSDYLRGYQAALFQVRHTAGEALAHLYGAEKRRVNRVAPPEVPRGSKDA